MFKLRHSRVCSENSSANNIEAIRPHITTVGSITMSYTIKAHTLAVWEPPPLSPWLEPLWAFHRGEEYAQRRKGERIKQRLCTLSSLTPLSCMTSPSPVSRSEDCLSIHANIPIFQSNFHESPIPCESGSLTLSNQELDKH